MSDSFHGTPITPNWLLKGLCVGQYGPVIGLYCFCVSYWRPDQISLVCKIARRVMIDCGAFSVWQENLKRIAKGLEPIVVDYAFRQAYYAFCRLWLAVAPPGSFFVIFDEIDAGSQVQDALLDEVPEDLLPYAWPVWHMDEPVSRAIMLWKRFGRICVGSTGEFVTVGSPEWRARIDELSLAAREEFGEVPPPTHMLRGLQCQKPEFDTPFSQVDSAHEARNHNRLDEKVGGLFGETKQELFKADLDRWERLNCPTVWPKRLKRRRPPAHRVAHQPDLYEGQAA